MKWFWQNPPNPALREKNLSVTPEYTRAEGILTAVCVALFMPVMLVVYPVGKLLLGAFMLAGQAGFHTAECLMGRRADEPRYRFQFIRAFICSQMAARLPHINTGFRKYLYRQTGLTLGRGGFIGQGGIWEDLHPENVAVEDGAMISFGVTIVAHGPKRGGDRTVIVRRGAYVGAAAVLLPGIEIGEYATVGAGSVVTKSVPPGAVAAGAPARVLYYREGYDPAEKETQDQMTGGSSSCMAKKNA